MKSGLLTLIWLLIVGSAFAQSQPDWIYEWNADQKPLPGPDFTYQGVLILKKAGSSLSSRPTDGKVYQVGDIIGDGEAVYRGLGDPNYYGSHWADIGLILGETYYYKLFSFDSEFFYSPGVETEGIIAQPTPTPFSWITPSPTRTPPLPITSPAELLPDVRLRTYLPELPSPYWSPLAPPDVSGVTVAADSTSIMLRWSNPRDLVGWGCEGSDCCSISSGIATLDTFTSESKCCYSKSAGFSNAGYTVEFRMKVIDSAPDSRLFYRSIATRNFYSVNILTLEFSEDHVWLRDAWSDFISMDTTDDFHTYRIIGSHRYGNVYDGILYIDGQCRHSGRVTNQAPAFTGVYFGDATGGGSQSQWDYIRYAYGAYPPPTPIPTITPRPTPTPIPTASASFTPTPTCTPYAPGTPTPTPTPLPLILGSGDYNGDGTSDVVIFRPRTGLWAIKSLTRLYFGTAEDLPVSGDYNGDGTTNIAVFRGYSGLWSIKGITRTYFGNLFDIPVPGDYDGDGSCNIGIFRSDNGLWAIRNITRIYHGGSGDLPVPGDYNGDGSRDIAVFNQEEGIWVLRGITTFSFGIKGDRPLSGDYNGDGTRECGIFRFSSGLWLIREVTRMYFGSTSDQPVPADYDGDASDDIGIFRNSSGLWGIQALSRVYFGAAGDIPVTR